MEKNPMGVAVKAEITNCKGGHDMWNFRDDPKPCEYCNRTDTTDYEFEVTVYLNKINTKSYAYCCTSCHKENCPIHNVGNQSLKNL